MSRRHPYYFPRPQCSPQNFANDRTFNAYLQQNPLPTHYVDNNSSSPCGSGLFPGYAQSDNRCVPTGFPSLSFDSRLTQMQKELANKQLSEEVRRAKREKERAIQLYQESLPEGQKRITLCSDDEDEDDYPAPIAIVRGRTPPVDPTPSSSYEPKQKKKRKHEKHRQTKKKSKKRRYHSSSSSVSVISESSYSSSSSDNEEEPSRKHKSRHRSSKRSKKKRSKKSKRRHSTSSSSSSSFTEDNRRKHNKSKDQLDTLSSESHPSNFLDVRNNPWKLLPPRDYGYRPTHIVIDPRCDVENLMFEQPPKKLIAIHFSCNQAISKDMGVFPLNDPEIVVTNTDRYFSPQISKYFKKGKAGERRFRKKSSVFDNFILLSQFPCESDDEVENLKKELSESQFANMGLSEYEELMKSRSFTSFDEANLNGKNSILCTRCNLNPQDVEAWLMYSRLQPRLTAKNECGDPNAEVINKRALFERQTEILSRASKNNPANIELALEKIKLLEQFYGIGSIDVNNAWKALETRFINSIQMWKLNIKMKQNDRTTFECSKILKFIDKCLYNLVDLKDGVKLSHQPEENTEKFLVDLIVQRCKLCTEAGFFDKAIAMLQALTEFHFFTHDEEKKPSRASKSRIFVMPFKIFWELGLPRIGEEGASGWKNSDYSLDTTAEENCFLRQQVKDIQEHEDILLKELREKNFSNIETWRQVEMFRSEQFWRPVRNNSHLQEIYEYTSRIVQFDDFSRIIFAFRKRHFAIDLVLRILQVLGAVIPGMVDNSQYAILSEFADGSAQNFPQMSLNYDNLDKFFINYFDLLLEGDGIDKLRIRCAKLTTCAKFFVNLSYKEKKKRMGDLMKEIYHANIFQLDKAILLFHHAKLYEQLNMSELGLKEALYILKGNNKNIWSMSPQESSVYYEITRWLCERLPFSSDIKSGEDANNAGTSSDSVDDPKTKYELLYWIGINGILKRSKQNEDNDDAARKRWKTCLIRNKETESSGEGTFKWFCNEQESLIELSALFFYEGSQHNLKQFNLVMQNSPMAKIVGNTESINRLKISVYEHNMNISTHVAPRDLQQLLKNAITDCPYNVFFLKKYLNILGSFNGRQFLSLNPGDDELSKRLRTCALIYIQWRNYMEIMESATELQKNQCFNALRLALEKGAVMTAETSMPDAYLWCLLMHIKQENSSSVRRIDELFSLAQKQCPWSKRLLYETARKRSDNDGFQTTLTNIISTTGIHQYCQFEEVPLLFEPDVQNEEYLEESDEEMQ